VSNLDEVKGFLSDFDIKYKVFDIIFVDARVKNANTLLLLDIPPAKRREIIESILAADYVHGPLDDTLYGIVSMWVFGKSYKQQELYIKISMGRPGSSVICISFHPAEKPLHYPYKNPL